jgi:hypothetical protein
MIPRRKPAQRLFHGLVGLVETEPTAAPTTSPPTLAQVEERAQEIIAEILEPKRGRGRPKKHKSDEERKAADAKRKRNKRAQKNDATKAAFLLVLEYENLKAEVGCTCSQDEDYLGTHYCDERLNELAERIEREGGITKAELARYEWQQRRQNEVGTGGGLFMRDGAAH